MNLKKYTTLDLLLCIPQKYMGKAVVLENRDDMYWFSWGDVLQSEKRANYRHAVESCVSMLIEKGIISENESDICKK